MKKYIFFNSRGSVLFLITVVSCFLSALILLAVETFSLGIQAVGNYEDSLRLFYVAEAGLAHGQAFCRNYGCEEGFDLEEVGDPVGEIRQEMPPIPFYEWLDYGRGEYFLEIFLLHSGAVQPYLDKDSGVLIVATAALKGRENIKTLCLLLEEGPSWKPIAWWEPQ